MKNKLEPTSNIVTHLLIGINAGSMSSSLSSTKQLLDTNDPDDVNQNERMSINVVISIEILLLLLNLCSNGNNDLLC